MVREFSTKVWVIKQKNNNRTATFLRTFISTRFPSINGSAKKLVILYTIRF